VTRHVYLLAFLFATATAIAQAAPPPHDCEKNVSFAVAEGGQPVPAVPEFVEKWTSNRKHQKEFPGLCFSQIPDGRAQNYLVIFSISSSVFAGMVPAAHTYTRTTPGPYGAGAINGHGGTWDYSYSGSVTALTTSTASLRMLDRSKTFFARVYDQQGAELAQYSVGTYVSRERALENAFGVISNDRQPERPQKPFAAPLSVYYVNCDVDSEAPHSAAAPEMHSDPAPEPTPDPIFELWSSPEGADVLLDGIFAGRTPLSLKVTAGEHTVIMQKQNFGTWQRKTQAVPGTRRVAAYLEQKIVVLGFAPE